MKDFAAMAYLGAAFWPVGLTCEKIEDLAQKKSKDPRRAWFVRPLLAAAQKAEGLVRFVDKYERLALSAVIGSSLAGLAGGITALHFAWSGLGASWGALLTMKGFGLALGAVGIGAAVAPVVATAVSAVGIIAIPIAVMCARGWRDIKREYIAGREETHEWKQEQEDLKSGKKPHPLIAAAEARRIDLESHGAHERAVLFHRLRTKFPAEFDDAVRRTDHDTVLRDKVQVLKQIKLKMPLQKKRGVA